MEQYFSDEQASLLQELLLALSEQQACMDYAEAYGFLTHHILCPGLELTEEAIDFILYGDNDAPNTEPDAKTLNVKQLIQQLYKGIEKALYLEQQYELPCEPSLGNDPNASPFRGWAIGFMDGYFVAEESWGDANEDIQSLLLPIAIAAGEDVELPANHPLLEPQNIEESFDLISEDIIDIYSITKN